MQAHRPSDLGAPVLRAAWCLNIAGLLAASLAGAATFQGTVRESLHLMGVDSVKVTLKGASGVAYTDTAGRFQLEAGPTSLGRPAGARPQMIWRAATRTVEWDGIPGDVAVEVRDARGTLVRRVRARGEESGSLRLAPPGQGLYFASVRASGRTLAWKWYELPGGAGLRGGVEGARDAVFPLAKAARSAAETDTLVFERQGFAAARVAAPASTAALDVKLKRQPIKLLLIDGASNHNWQQTTRVVKALLDKSGYFAVTVSNAPSNGSPQSAWDAWNPRFADHEIVLLNYNSGHTNGSQRWPRAREQALEAFVSGGGGLYVLHSANNGFPEWPEYNKMIGTGWRDANFGFALEVKDGQVVRIPPGTGGGTGHGNRIDAPIQILTPHPIHKGYPRKYLTANLEIYYHARGPAENCTVLSYAYDAPSAGNTLRNWPIELMVAYGKGRVYNSTPGHVWSGEAFPPAIRDLAWQTTLVRAAEWLARKEVFFPVPTPFNTETKIEYRDIVVP